MKNIKKSILYIPVIMLVLLFSACTDNFKDYNTEPYAPTEIDPSLLFYSMINPSIFTQANQHQHTEQMIGADYGGYLSMVNAWTHSTFGSYNPADGWIKKTYADIFSSFYSNFFKVEESSGKKGHYYAFALLLRVSAMHRLVDTFGPIPYSKIKNGESNTPFDSVEEVYQHMFEDLDIAIKGLSNFVKANPTFKPMENKDIIFDGDYAKWLKYANSLKLRLAIRIANVAPEEAQKRAEEAINNAGGLILTNDESAYRSLGVMDNPYHHVSYAWGDSRINASLTSYMNGYEDPRRAKYFTVSNFPESAGIENGYIGVRAGNNGVNKNASKYYSIPNFDKFDNVCLFRASETLFLEAEGALRGWNMGKDAKVLYEEAIKMSFNEYGLDAYADTYCNDTEKQPVNYNNPQNIGSYDFDNTTKIAWDTTGDFETNLEQIITQKWIANFPLGFEGWADFRRTGYPTIFPALNNLSANTVDDVRRARRVNYPLVEYKTNKENVEFAVSNLLGGPDNMGTDLWWAKK